MALDHVHVLDDEATPGEGLSDVSSTKHVQTDVVRGQHLLREVDSSSFHVFVDVAKHVDELHLNPQINGMEACLSLIHI